MVFFLGGVLCPVMTDLLIRINPFALCDFLAEAGKVGREEGGAFTENKSCGAGRERGCIIL